MIKYALILGFYAWLLIPASLGDGQIMIQFWPFVEPIGMRMGNALFLFATLGMVLTALLTMIDQFQLRLQNKRLRKENDRLNEEIASLRNIMTMERDEE